MDALEYIVRPFSVRDPFGRVIIPSTPLGTRERATLEWGAEATMPARQEQEGAAFELHCCKEDLKENSRESDTKRIYQNGNTSSENWVDVERPRAMKLKKTNANNCGDDWDQLSGVGQEINSALGAFELDIHSGTAGGGKDKNCSVSWRFTYV